MSCDICRGFTFLLPSCVKGQSLQMGLWNGWGSVQQLCWPTALPCWSTQRGRWLALRWVLRGHVEGEPVPEATLLADPSCAIQWGGWGCCGAGRGSTDC